MVCSLSSLFIIFLVPIPFFHVLCQCQMTVVRCSQLQIWLLRYFTNSCLFHFASFILYILWNSCSHYFFTFPGNLCKATVLRPMPLRFFFRSLIMDFSSSPKQVISVNLGQPHASRYCSINFHFLVSFSPCSVSPFLNRSRLVKTAYVKYPHEAFFVAACFPSLTSKNAKEVAWYSRAMRN